MFRGKIFVSDVDTDAMTYHQNAINKAFAGMSDHTANRTRWRIMDGKEDIIFGFALEDGSDWVDSSSQLGRKEMYGFNS